MLVCSKCGNSASEGLFCPICGGRLTEASAKKDETKLKSSMGNRHSFSTDKVEDISLASSKQRNLSAKSLQRLTQPPKLLKKPM